MTDDSTHTSHTLNTHILEFTSDPSTVFFIHPSDNTAQSFVSEKFEGENYITWKRSMIIGLATKNKMCFVDGSLPKPAETDPTYKAWVICNEMVIGWILKSLGPVQAKSIFFFKTASEMWQDLEERYGQTSSTQLFAIQEEIANIQQEDDNVAEFYSKIKVLWDELDDVCPLPICECNKCACNLTAKFLKILQDQRLIQFLMKLKDEYRQTRSSIIMMHPLPPISQAYKILLQEQKHKQISDVKSNTSETMAFIADRKRLHDSQYSRNNQDRNSYNTLRGGFTQGKGGFNSESGNYKKHSLLHCDHCHYVGYHR